MRDGFSEALRIGCFNCERADCSLRRCPTEKDEFKIARNFEKWRRGNGYGLRSINVAELVDEADNSMHVGQVFLAEEIIG